MKIRFLLLGLLFHVITIQTFAQLTVGINSDIVNNEWTASWITHPSITGKEFGVYLFRKDFTLAAQPEKFIVHVSADNRYKLYVNGTQVCNGPARGDLLKWYYESVDIASYLKSGQNVITAEVWNVAGQIADAQITSMTGFILQGNTSAQSIINTDATWSVFRDIAYIEVGGIFHITGPGEKFNGVNHPWGWMQSDFDFSGWNKVKVLEKGRPLNSLNVWGGPSRYILYPRTIPAMEEKMQRFSSVRRSDLPNLTESFLKGEGTLIIPANTHTKILIDQKVLTNAYPVLNYSKGAKSEIKITYAEGLYNAAKEKGNRDEIENRHINGNSDLIIADGGDNRTYKTLWWRTFRYVELEIQTGTEPLTLHDFYSIFTGYPLEEKASFKCDDPMMTNIWNVGWRTQRLCTFETFMDCPYYEQLQYVGDTRIQANVTTYVTGDSKLVKKAIASINESRLPSGITQSRYPANAPQIIPPFSLVWNTMVYDYWILNDDKEFVRSMIPGMMETLNWFEARMNPTTGLLGKMEYWNFVDWVGFKNWDFGVPPGQFSGNSSVTTLQYAYTLQKSALLFNAFGMKEEASRYISQAEKIKTSVYKSCWNQAKGMIADTPDKTNFSQHTNALAILTNTIPRELQASVANTILNNKDIAECSLYFRFYLTEAIEKAGLADKYPDMLDPWKKMLSIGLTTFAEVQDAPRSDCHAWSASPLYYFLSLTCGIKPNEPGFKSVRIEPKLGRLNSIEGSMPHPLGTIKVQLQKSNQGHLTGVVTLPENLNGIFVWNGKKLSLKGGLNQINIK